MKLLRLRLENFRQHRDSDIVFQDGMTAIVGANGTGKTTILEAITFALYGVQRRTKESIKFYWAEPRAKLHVMLEFTFEGRRYQLDRTGTDASLVDTTEEPWVTKSTGLREVKASCERLLRLTYDQFKNSFCAEQKSLTFLQFNTDTRRQEQVAKMLGFDRLKLASELAYKRGKHFRWQAEELGKSIGDPAKLRADVELARGELTCAQEAKRLAGELGALHAGMLPAAEERKGHADLYLRLTQEAKVFMGQADALKASRKRAEDAVLKSTADVLRRKELLPSYGACLQLEEGLREMQALRELELDRQNKASELTRLDTEIKDLETRIAALKGADVEVARAVLQTASTAYVAAGMALRAAEAAWSKARQTSQATLSTAQAELKQAQGALTKAQSLVAMGICPECGQPTKAGFEGKLRTLGNEVAVAEKDLHAAQETFKSVETRPKEVFDAEEALHAAGDAQRKAQDVLTAAEKSSSQAAGLQGEREAKGKRAATLKAELGQTVSRFDREAYLKTEAQLKELRPLRDECLKLAGAEDALKAAEAAFDEARKEIEEARNGYQALMSERAKLPIESPEQAGEAIREFEDVRRRAADAKAQEMHAEAMLKVAETRLKQGEERIQSYERDEATLKERRLEALLHETADRELKLLREELNSVIRPDLEARASENLSLLTNGRYPVIELDEEFNPTVIEEGVQKQVISGGEEDVVALALRMALSELIQERQGRPMSLMILDEVFGSLDADHRQAVLERLQAIKGRFAQILVISHIEEINQVADHCIFLTRDDQTRATVVGDPPVETDELVLRG